MPDSPPPTNGKSSVLEVNTTIPVEELCRLLHEYTNELVSLVDLYGKKDIELLSDGEDNEIYCDARYLIDRLGRLVDIGSAYHEIGEVGEGERYWLELYLMRAANALRRARRLFGSSLPLPFQRLKNVPAKPNP